MTRAHRYGVGVHHAAGCVLVIGQDALYSVAVLIVHGLQNLAGDLLRKLLENICKIIGLKAKGELGNLLSIKLAEYLSLNIFVEIENYAVN